MKQNIILIILLVSLASAGCIFDKDTDGDGYADKIDAFPNDSRYHLDSDGDGYANKIDLLPTDPRYHLDSDFDGYADEIDVFPNDPQYHLDHMNAAWIEKSSEHILILKEHIKNIENSYSFTYPEVRQGQVIEKSKYYRIVNADLAYNSGIALQRDAQKALDETKLYNVTAEYINTKEDFETILERCILLGGRSKEAVESDRIKSYQTKSYLYDIKMYLKIINAFDFEKILTLTQFYNIQYIDKKT